MLVVVTALVLAVPIAVLAVALVRWRERAITAQAQLDAALAESRATKATLDEELDTVRDDLAAMRSQLEDTRDELERTAGRADTAEAALRDARDHLESALLESESVSTTLDAVREELVAATTALASASDGADASALWALEIARSERRWQLSVAPGMDLPSPFATAPDQLKLAVEVEASALREEVGTRIDVAWDLSIELPEEASLLVLRLAQELLADAAIRAETLELRVGPGDDGEDGVAVALRALDEEGELVPVALPPLAAGRVRPTEAGVWVVARS